MIKTPTGETPFSLAYENKVMVHVEIGMSSLRRKSDEMGTIFYKGVS